MPSGTDACLEHGCDYERLMALAEQASKDSYFNKFRTSDASSVASALASRIRQIAPLPETVELLPAPNRAHGRASTGR